MRLGKEQAAGYVEDTGADALAAEQQSGALPKAAVPEAAEAPLTVA